MVPTSFPSFFLRSYSADIVLARRASSHGGTDLITVEPCARRSLSSSFFHFHARLLLTASALLEAVPSLLSIKSLIHLECDNVLTWRGRQEQNGTPKASPGLANPSRLSPCAPWRPDVGCGRHRPNPYFFLMPLTEVQAWEHGREKPAKTFAEG